MAKAESLRIPLPHRLDFDVDEANALIDQAFDSQGWLLNSNDGPTHAVDKLRHALFVSFTSNHVVTGTAARDSRTPLNELIDRAAVTKYRLYIELFPDGPGAQIAARSNEEIAAKDFLANYIWKQCTPTNRKAWLQNELLESGLVVLETKVIPDDPGTPAEQGRYVTNVNEPMLDFLEHKVFEDVRKKIAEADAWLATFQARNPLIALPSARKARAALRTAVESAVHANPSFIRETLALSEADEADEELTSGGGV